MPCLYRAKAARITPAAAPTTEPDMRDAPAVKVLGPDEEVLDAPPLAAVVAKVVEPAP